MKETQMLHKYLTIVVAAGLVSLGMIADVSAQADQVSGNRYNRTQARRVIQPPGRTQSEAANVTRCTAPLSSAINQEGLPIRRNWTRGIGVWGADPGTCN
jgi:hypothetical protein